MTRKEFDTLKEGDEVILQCSGHLNGTKVVVRGCSDNGAVVIRMPQGWYSVYNYAKLRKQK